MKQTILGADRSIFQKNIRKNILLCILVFCAITCVHIVCTVGRTAENHTWMLLLNIGADVLGGSFLIASLSICVLPGQKLLRFYDQAAQEADGQVLEIGEDLTHYIGVDCYELSLPDRHLFLPADSIRLTVGENYRFRLKGNLIVEVCSYGEE